MGLAGGGGGSRCILRATGYTSSHYHAPYCCLIPLHISLHFQAVALCAKVNKGEEDVEAAVEECADKVWGIV